MANILEFLRGVLTDPGAQGAFRADPPGFLDRAGFADLTGEDVVEAVLVLRRSLPDDAAKALAPFEDEDGLPPVRPAHDEQELDAAVRVLAFAVDQAPPPHEPEPEPGPDGEAVPAAAVAAEPEPEPVAAEAEDGTEAIAVESELDVAPGAAPVAALAPVTIDASSLPSVAAFEESLAAAAADTRSRFDETLLQFVADCEARAQATSDRYAELLRQAEADANEIRAGAEADIEEVRAAADADRATAHEELERTRVEADQLLQRARQEANDIRGQAQELLTAARSDAESTRRDIAVRKSEMREAERQLKERLTGIDSLFRTVLRDEDGDPSASS